ncbi:MAG: hypothetical protein ACPGGB_11190 [Flavobacteriales bacterium]
MIIKVPHIPGDPAKLQAILHEAGAGHQSAAFLHHYHVECFRPDGSLRWKDDCYNIVVNTGLDEVLDKVYKGSSYTAAHHVLLTDGTPTIAAGDTMASHAGWVEVTAYSESVRQALTLGTVASQSVDNSASKAAFSIDTNSTTVGGAGITTNNTKGGTTGILMGAAAFSGGDKSTDDGDTLNVTVTLTAAAA